MDRIEKALDRLSTKERARVRTILAQLAQWRLYGLNMQKLHGQHDIFRIRKGDIRIIFRVTQLREIFLLAVERRSEKTYRDF
ncbi:hypothetical protein A3H75_02365 [Candidatus Uhrbacteria bacterium RIFCSPLOWO2_02_FULL_51_9]|uniref:Type II toxin-antitoxin system RelE/ParE family toxin n=1 Tax=Candidatus Uhrbacteria bacterium RIFCSPLOWO2_02_FULL_51_9 TaxID=1802410 RepID=A0A1F7VEY8_9BACT|nr:MAG: hypothetical protein A3H75_02365 [Candidatus Uhrbacteria bacterium RIFCSPLOWO2_02_FULL_51_9]